MLFLSLPTLACFVVSDDISLIGKLFLSIPTWGCVDISNEFDLVAMLWLDRPKVRIFILKMIGVNRGDPYKVLQRSTTNQLKNQDGVQRILTQILVKPGLNGLKAATPLVLNKEKRYERSRYQSWTGGADARPIPYQYSIAGSPIHYRHTCVTIADDYRPKCRPTLARYVDLHSADSRPTLDRYSIGTLSTVEKIPVSSVFNYSEGLYRTTICRWLVRRPNYSARLMRFGSRAPSEFFTQILHRNALTEIAWEDAVQGLGGNVYRSVIEKQGIVAGIVVYRQRVLQTVTSLSFTSILKARPPENNKF